MATSTLGVYSDGSQRILFTKLNKIDLSNLDASITVTDTTASNNGQSFIDFVRNRNNTSAWLTTGSNDAANTQLDIDTIDERDINRIIIVGHNLKAYTIQFFNGTIFTDFSTVIAETNDLEDTTAFTFDLVSTAKIRIIITGTKVADADKIIKQLYITEDIGQLQGWPIIRNAKHTTNKRIGRMLSGKINSIESVGGFACDLRVSNYNIDADLTIIEKIYFGKRGVQVWLCGGNEDQFSHKRIGYRKEDIFLMRVTNDYQDDWVSGVYKNGIKILMKLAESIN